MQQKVLQQNAKILPLQDFNATIILLFLKGQQFCPFLDNPVLIIEQQVWGISSQTTVTRQ